MMEQIRIRCINNGRIIEVAQGSSMSEVLAHAGLEHSEQILIARVNNITKPLSYRAYKDKDVEFLDLQNPSTQRAYLCSLFCVMGKAIKKLFGREADFSVDAPVSNGYYCVLRLAHKVTADDIDAIQAEMNRIVAEDLPFVYACRPAKEITERFEQEGLHTKANLVNSVGRLYEEYYTLGDYADSYFGALVESTGKLKVFGLMRYADGVLLRIPDPNNPSELKPLLRQDKMFDVFRTLQDWQRIIGLRTISDLNAVATSDRIADIINVSEAFQEKRICQIAESIEKRPEVRIVLISGPSSSGKTTFSKRLSVQLMACGLKPYAISMDDYFVDRDKTPCDEKGDYDFESIEALNIALLQEHLQALFEGRTIELPRYNFITGKSEQSGQQLTLGPRDIIVMEGIHALNPRLTEAISDVFKFKVYVSALTTISLDDHNYIPTTDNRLLRRIVRDYKYRNYSAQSTIARWSSVRAGEHKWIFPYQENADIMFNSALLYELSGLRTQAMSILEMVPEEAPEYAEAYRLRQLLSYIRPIAIDKLPFTSLLREFVGGSSFQY